MTYQYYVIFTVSIDSLIKCSITLCTFWATKLTGVVSLVLFLFGFLHLYCLPSSIISVLHFLSPYSAPLSLHHHLLLHINLYTASGPAHTGWSLCDRLRPSFTWTDCCWPRFVASPCHHSHHPLLVINISWVCRRLLLSPTRGRK